MGRSRERGTHCQLPSTGGAIAVRKKAEERGPSYKVVLYHRMAPRVKASQLVEDRAAVCPGTGPRYFYFFLPSLVSVTPHPSVSFSLASSILTPRYTAAALTGPPRRAQSQDYPRPARGDVGQGRGLFILLLKCLNVRRFPPPSSRSTNCYSFKLFDKDHIT